MDRNELDLCKEYGRCPTCGGDLETLSKGLWKTDYSLSCIECKAVWNKSSVFLKEVDKVYAEEFLQSDDYILLKNFAKANVDVELDAQGYDKLKKLLEYKGYKISDDMLVNIFTYELFQQKIIQFKERMGYTSSMSLNEIIDVFVRDTHYWSTDVATEMNATFTQNNVDYVAYEKGEKIIVESNSKLNDRWIKTLTDVYDQLGGSIYRKEGFKSIWELRWQTRVKFVYDNDIIDLLFMVLENLDLKFEKEDFCKQLFYATKKHELEQFENKLRTQSYRTVSISDIDAMTGVEFETFLVELFTKMGYTAKKLGSSYDQGADLLVSKSGELIAVQAKRYGSKVNNKAVQEVVASLQYYSAGRGMVITTDEFTKSAIELARANDVELIDRSKLEQMVKDYY